MNIQDFLTAVLKQDAECLFSAAKISQLKNTAEFAYRQTSLIDVCAYRARIEQLPKFTLCSVVQF